jgi:hypothetical protein
MNEKPDNLDVEEELDANMFIRDEFDMSFIINQINEISNQYQQQAVIEINKSHYEYLKLKESNIRKGIKEVNRLEEIKEVNRHEEVMLDKTIILKRLEMNINT